MRVMLCVTALCLLITFVSQIGAQIPPGWTVWPRQAYGGGLPGNSSYPIDAMKLNQTNPGGLATSSAGQCSYIEQQFMETFQGPLNLTKWLPTGSVAIPANQKPLIYGTQQYWTRYRCVRHIPRDMGYMGCSRDDIIAWLGRRLADIHNSASRQAC